MATAASSINRRALSKERRRRQLIDATIKCISNKGLGSLTLGAVANEAGLSQGIVNLHFKSKDNLLSETLRFLIEDYDAQFMQTVEQPSRSAAETLLALMELDLKPTICDRKKLSVWFAFWGEVKAVPTYQKIGAAYDDKFCEIIIKLCERIINEGNYRNISAQTVTDTLTSLTDGLWLSCLINPKSFDRKAALRCIYSYLCVVFPEHFEAEEDEA